MTLPATSFTEARPKSFRISSKRDALGPSRDVLLGPRVKAQSILCSAADIGRERRNRASVALILAKYV